MARFSFPAFTCSACHSLRLQIFVNNICVHCQMQTLLMAVSYAREHWAKSGKTSEDPYLELFPGLKRRHLGA